tara:strand:- start:1754 stop:2623 length:870 start_codon:yes stop_codon:yes gene_type:complete
MKHSYFAPGKAGKYLIRDMFWLNNKTHAGMSSGEPPLYAHMTTPDGHFDWYWEDSSGRLVQASYEVDDVTILNFKKYSETWFPVKTNGVPSIKKFLKDSGIKASQTCPGMFHKCFEHAFQADLLVNPLPMLGYVGVIGSRKMSKIICNREPNMENIPLEYVIDELRKRKNIITHKENMEELARNFFLGDGHFPYMNPDVYFTDTEEKFIHETTKTINQNRKFEKDMADLLDYYDIPYEWFNLDTGDYSETFGLEKTFDKNEDPHHHLYDNFVDKKISDKWISDYVKNYP